jgi:DNA polymerase-1
MGDDPKKPRVISIDIEHSSDGPMRPYDDGFYMTCVGITDLEGNREVYWFEHSEYDDPEGKAFGKFNLERVRKRVEEADIIVAHNLKHDMTILRYYGISFEKQALWCTMVTEYLLSGQDVRNRTFGLNAVAEHYELGSKKDKVAMMWAAGTDTYDIPTDILREYVLSDCDLALNIYKKQVNHPEYQYIEKVHKLQMEFTLSLSDMELYGFKFDVDKANEIVAKLDSEMEATEGEIKTIAKQPHINIGSAQQRSALLFGGLLKTTHKEWVIQTLKTKPESKYYEKKFEDTQEISGLGFAKPKAVRADGYYSTDKNTIENLRCNTPTQKRIKSLLLEYSVVKKARETLRGKNDKGLINKVRADGHIHPNLNQAVTATGRLSSSDPNSQNMPRGSTSPLKKCIVPEYDLLLQADLSQIEWRGAMELSEDAVGLHEVNAGIDQHAEACTNPKLMNLPLTKDNRTDAKVFNFRMIYGGSPYGFFMDTKMPNFPLKRWKQIVFGFENKYYGLTNWQQANITHVMRYGCMRIKTGRKFVFNRGEGGEYNERQIKNYPVQGLAGGDILPLCAVIIRRGMLKAGLESRMILTVHDSIVFDILNKEKERLVKLINLVLNNLTKYIINYYNTSWSADLAGEIEVGPNYADLKEIKL